MDSFKHTHIYRTVNKHERFKVSRMSCVLNENSELLLLNSYTLSLGIQYVKEKNNNREK